jgi:hypothetical protein
MNLNFDYGLSPNVPQRSQPMKFLLPVNRVADSSAEVRVNSNGSGVDIPGFRINHHPDVPTFSLVGFDLEVDFFVAMTEVANSDVFPFPPIHHSPHGSTRSKKDTGIKRC